MGRKDDAQVLGDTLAPGLTYGKKLRNYELLLYGAAWLLIFLFPLLAALFDYLSAQSAGTTFGWKTVLSTWGRIVPFFALFIIHNFIISPFFFRKGGLRVYLLATCILLILYGGWIFHAGPALGDPFHGQGHPPMGMEEGHVPPRPGMGPPPGEDGSRMAPPPGERMQGDSLFSAPPFREGEEHFRPGGPDGLEHRMKPFGLELMEFMIVILMMLVNLGVKYFFQSLVNERRLAQLERENLTGQLEYLRYQINPHFFMNTLNNIHALVDIDQEQAKSSILELSRLMRFILYEGSKPTIPLSRETDFLGHYIALMRIRFSEGVRIELDVPDDCSGVEIPPLLFVSYVENAFKHGVSYDSDSFVRVGISLDGGKLIFRCANSVPDPSLQVSSTTTSSSREGGVGQQNVKRRLDLLYGSDYTLHIDTKQGMYEVLLIIPVDGGASSRPAGDS